MYRAAYNGCLDEIEMAVVSMKQLKRSFLKEIDIVITLYLIEKHVSNIVYQGYVL